MSINRKFLIAGASVAALTAMAAYAIADSGHGRGGMGHGMGQGMMGGQRGAGMGSQDPAQRLASAKTELGIKPEQAAAWETYAKVVIETAAERRRVRENIDRDAVHAMKPQERQAFRDSNMKQRDAAHEKIKAAAETLLAQLDDAQKSKARINLPGLVEDARGHGMRQGMSGGPGHGQGMGMRHGEGMGHRWQR